MPRTLATIIDAQIKKIIKLDEEYYTAVVLPEDIHTVYVLVKNLPDDYVGGEYLFKLDIPAEFPDKPPHLHALTPNGLFELGGQICVSIGTFHQSDFRTTKAGTYGWRPAIGLSGFILNGIINAMLHFDKEDSGIRIKWESPEVKKKLAKKSVEYNKNNHARICNLFEGLKCSEIGSKLKIWSKPQSLPIA